MDIPMILQSIRPGEEWSLDGESYDGLIWHSDTEKPTEEDLRKAWPTVQKDRAYSDLRSKRDQRLADSDWTQIPDAPVDAKAWAAYRQALRDLPATIKDPTAEIDWPTPPE